MRNHGCNFAKYCCDYTEDACQGCPRSRIEYDRWLTNPVVEHIKESFAKENTMVTREEMNRILRRQNETSIYATPPKPTYLEISRVIFSNPATIVLWEDGSKTIVKCQEGDVYSKETGLALCIAKKALGNMPNFNNVFHKWIPEE